MSVTFDKKLDTHVCSVHGNIDHTGWVPCWACGGAGGNDAHEDDAINYAPGEEWETCDECKGKEGWHVCPVCCADNPDVEW